MSLSKFDMKYVKAMVNNLKNLYPDMDNKFLEDIVAKKITNIEVNSKAFEIPKEKLKISITNKEKETKEFSNFKSILDILEEEQSESIITGNGALYHSHKDEIKVLNSILVQLLLSERTVYKKKKLENLNNKELREFFDTLQKIYKILVNSYYGASIEKNSIFYDPYMGSSITLSGRIVITTALNAFESLFNNFYFKNENDFLLYIERIKEQEYNYPDIININIDKETLFNYIIEKYEENPVNKEIIRKAINNLDQTMVNKIYYKNNIFKLLDNKIPSEILSSIAGTRDFMDPNEDYTKIDKDKSPDKYNDAKYRFDVCSELWKYVEEWCAFKHMYFYRYEFANSHKRKTVLVVDTDSNFLYLKPFSNYCRDKFPERYMNYDDPLKISTINICTFLLTRYINEMYFMMGAALRIDEEKRSMINMKNEFMVARIMLTKNKKSYGGIIVMNEGKLLNPPELDMKGLALRKTSLNKNIRDYFSNTLEEKILKSEKIDMSSIYSDYEKIENQIKDSIKSGDTNYLIPSKVNEIDSYKTPYQIQSLRGALLWNALFPDEEFAFPEKVNILKLKEMNLTELKEKIPEDYFNKVIELFKNHTELQKYGVSILSIPKKVKKIPEFLIDLIDYDTMINDHIKPALILLESLGFKTLNILEKQYPTNIIEI